MKKKTRVPMAQATKDKIRKTHMEKSYERTEETREKMREAKLGRTFPLEHRLSMAASQILKASQRHDTCPVTVALASDRYDEETKQLLVEKIIEKQAEFESSPKS